MDIGTAATTEYEYVTPDDGRIMDLYNEKPELMEYRMGSVHSHNSMSAFMSSTDNNELKKGSKNSDFYLMLVVNNQSAFNWVASVGVMVEVEKDIKSKYRFFNGNRRELASTVKEDVFYSYEFDVLVEDEDFDFSDLDKQIEDTKAIKEKERKAAMSYYPQIQNHNRAGDDIDNYYHQESLWGENARNFNEGFPTNVKKERMTFEGRRLAFDTIDINDLCSVQIAQGVLTDSLLVRIIKDNFDAIIEQGMVANIDLSQSDNYEIIYIYADTLFESLLENEKLADSILEILSESNSELATMLNKLLTENLIDEKYGVSSNR